MARDEYGLYPSGFLGKDASAESLRLWLLVVRTTLGWSVEETAKRTEVEADTIVRLEATGEPLNEDDDDCLCGLACDYEKALHEMAASLDERFKNTDYSPARNLSKVVRGLDNFVAGLRGDFYFPMARRLRQRRAELRLTIEQVAERTAGKFSAKQLVETEFTGVVGMNDFDGDIRALATALELPFLELRMVAERGAIDADDLDEWVRWRSQQSKRRRAA